MPIFTSLSAISSSGSAQAREPRPFTNLRPAIVWPASKRRRASFSTPSRSWRIKGAASMIWRIWASSIVDGSLSALCCATSSVCVTTGWNMIPTSFITLLASAEHDPLARQNLHWLSPGTSGASGLSVAAACVMIVPIFASKLVTETSCDVIGFMPLSASLGWIMVMRTVLIG